MKKKILSVIILCILFFAQAYMIFVPIDMINTYLELIRPIVWIIMLIFTIVLFEKNEQPYKQKSNLFAVSILGVSIYLFIMAICGLLLKFSYSPLEFTLKGIATRLWTYTLIQIIREYLRSKVMTSTTNRNKWVMMAFVTIVFAFTSIDNIRSVVRFDLIKDFDYFMTVLLPNISLNLFLTYAALKGGFKSNLLYSIVYYSVPLYLPILPGISKILDAVIGCTIVFIMYIVFTKLEWNDKKKRDSKLSDFHWKWLIFPGVVFIIAIFLGLGVFPFMPVSVASDSMKGEFQKGDIVIVYKVKKESINKIESGQIIQYRARKHISNTQSYRDGKRL